MSAKTPVSFDAGCGPALVLTIKQGAGAGRTLVDCTCGWSKIFKSKKKAHKRLAEHEGMNQ